MIKDIFDLLINIITTYVFLSWLVFFIDWNTDKKHDIEVEVSDWEVDKVKLISVFVLGTILLLIYLTLNGGK